MKTGNEVMERALRLLGYVNSRGHPDSVRDAALFKRAANAVIQIYDDLKRIDLLGDKESSLFDMTEVLKLSPSVIHDVMPYGVAMLIAQNEGDSDAQALFAALYSSKRASVPQKRKTICDVLPRGGY